MLGVCTLAANVCCCGVTLCHGVQVVVDNMAMKCVALFVLLGEEMERRGLRSVFFVCSLQAIVVLFVCLLLCQSNNNNNCACVCDGI